MTKIVTLYLKDKVYGVLKQIKEESGVAVSNQIYFIIYRDLIRNKIINLEDLDE